MKWHNSGVWLLCRDWNCRTLFINYTQRNGVARNVKDACKKPETRSQCKMCIKWWKISHCFTVSDFKFVSASQAAERYELCSIAIYLRRFAVFFTATIYRGILWPWRYWNRYVIIDDKCRGIVGIARIFFRSLRSGNSLYHISKELARWRQPPTTSKHNAFPHSNTERGDSVVLF